MADWSTPASLSTLYADVLTDLKARDVDAVTLQVAAPSNLPTGAIRWNRATNIFEVWDGAAFQPMLIDVAGLVGGTAALFRTAVGLGSIATQNANAIAITGGSIAGVTMDASVITSGTLAIARGGTGASLALGASGSVLQSNGAAVVFGVDGSILTGLNATNLAVGTVPSARLGTGGVGGGSKFLADDQTFKSVLSAYTLLAKNATYSVTTANVNGRTVIYCTGTFTLTIPAANDAGIVVPPQGLGIVNVGTGTITVTPSAGTIAGAASFSMPLQYYSIEAIPIAANNDWVLF